MDLLALSPLSRPAFLSIIFLILFAGCQSNKAISPEAEAIPLVTVTFTNTPTTSAPTLTIEPIATITRVPKATPTPSVIPEVTPTRTTTSEVASTVTPAPIAIATDDGKVYLGEILLLETEVDAPGCFSVGDISYSPTSEYFLVVLGCFEGDNEAFLFNADGSDRRQITGEWDYFNYFNYEWLDGENAFVYMRVNSCCVVPPPYAPPQDNVRYDIETGEKTPLSSYRVIDVQSDDTLNVRSGPGVENSIIGTLPPDGNDIKLTGDGVMVGESRWVPIVYGEITGWVNIHFLTQQSSR